MRAVTALPRRVREIDDASITLGDGRRLAARIGLPEDAERDALTHPHLADGCAVIAWRAARPWCTG